MIITANQNQAIALKRSKKFVQSKILSWQEFVTQAWEREENASRILKPVELNFIWQQCVEKAVKDEPVSVEALAKMAEEAWWLVQHWQIPWNTLQQSIDPNTQWFCKAAKLFESVCQKHHCIDEASAAVKLVSHTNGAAFSYYGFLQLTPLQKKFFSESERIEDEKSASVNAPKEVFVAEFDSPGQELDAALDWACRQYLENPQQNIAIVVPELQKYRTYIESELQARQDKNFSTPSLRWSFSVPLALSENGFCQVMLLLLKQTCFRQLELNHLISLMRSPYWGDIAAERMTRAAWILKLRELKVDKIDWETGLNVADAWPELRAWLHCLRQSASRKKQSLKLWVEDWRGLLASLRVHMREDGEIALDVLSELMPWQIGLSQVEALKLLQQVLQKLHCLGKTDPVVGGRIHVLGVLDAMTQSFDQLWLTGATQGNIPFKIFIQPLIDKKLQKKYGVWAMDPSVQTQWAKICYEKLKSLCKNFMISYANEEQGQVKALATFVREDAAVLHQKMVVEKCEIACDRNAQKTHALNKLKPWQPIQVPGGSGALKAQRLCPMQAFAKYRLDLKKLPEATLGLTPIERGDIVHKALQLIWQSLQTQENLLALDENALNTMLKKYIPQSLGKVSYFRRALLPASLLALEQEYLESILYEWLMLEKTRPPFKIYALETSSQILFAGREWQLRIDRMDQLADGRLLLIDYKTGSISTNDWQPDIFTDPQLPFYVVTNALKIDGIAFAAISDRGLKMSGYAQEEVLLGKLGILKAVEDWYELKSKWRDMLTVLVNNFVNADTRLEPLESTLTCAQCGLQSFCRIFETSIPLLKPEPQA